VEHVRDLGIGYTFLRPNLFFQGLLASARSISTRALVRADRRDHVQRRRRSRRRGGGRPAKADREGATCTLTGPAPITRSQLAAALTRALGRDVSSVDVPPPAFADSLHGILPPGQVESLLGTRG